MVGTSRKLECRPRTDENAESDQQSTTRDLHSHLLALLLLVYRSYATQTFIHSPVYRRRAPRAG